MHATFCQPSHAISRRSSLTAVCVLALQVTAGRPACLSRMDGHMVLVNSAALTLAGITADTPDPAGGIIDKDEAGQPTGILRYVHRYACPAIYATRQLY